VSGDPRFQDPERFPCAVSWCRRPANGWVGLELVPGSLPYRAETERVYLCDDHGPEWWDAADGKR
jgi:hypothetical protein